MEHFEIVYDEKIRRSKINIYKWQTILSKKLTKENKVIQLVKPKTKEHPTLTSDIYAFGEMQHIIGEISNTTIQKSLKSVKRLKLRG